MSAPTHCQLCAGGTPIATRNHGLDLCEPCSAGYLVGRLDHLGAQMVVDEVEREGRQGEVYHELHVVARMPGALPVFATFARKDLARTLRGLFAKDRLVLGDPLFDSRIWVQTRTAPLVRTLLANDGLQSAVMTLVAACGEVKLQPGLIDVRASVEDLDVRAEVPLAVGALLHYLARAA